MTRPSLKHFAGNLRAELIEASGHDGSARWEDIIALRVRNFVNGKAPHKGRRKVKRCAS